jgi:Spy/CpxP family protein refolding chaperone
MKPSTLVATLILGSTCAVSAFAQTPSPPPAPPAPPPAQRPAFPPGQLPSSPEDVSRALEQMAAWLRGMGSQWRDRVGFGPAERPLISLMLQHRNELGLSQTQVDTLERLRAEFGREAAQREAEIAGVESELTSLIGTDPVDVGQVEAKLRHVERMRADFRLARVRVIEQGKAQLTPEQLSRMRALVPGPSPPRPRAGSPGRGERL